MTRLLAETHFFASACISPESPKLKRLRRGDVTDFWSKLSWKFVVAGNEHLNLKMQTGSENNLFLWADWAPCDQHLTFRWLPIFCFLCDIFLFPRNAVNKAYLRYYPSGNGRKRQVTRLVIVGSVSRVLRYTFSVYGDVINWVPYRVSSCWNLGILCTMIS